MIEDVDRCSYWQVKGETAGGCEEENQIGVHHDYTGHSQDDSCTRAED